MLDACTEEETLELLDVEQLPHQPQELAYSTELTELACW
jgi:hypothetical protein